MKTKKMRMRRTSSRGALVATAIASVLVLACGTALGAKSDEEPSSRTLQGTVTTPDGTPAADTAVQLKNTRTLEVLSFITKDDGTYHFAGLKFDTEYQVRAQGPTGSTAWKRISVFDPRKTVVLNFKLENKK